MKRIFNVADAAYYLNNAVATLSLATEHMNDELAVAKRHEGSSEYTNCCYVMTQRMEGVYAPVLNCALDQLMDLLDAMQSSSN